MAEDKINIIHVNNDKSTLYMDLKKCLLKEASPSAYLPSHDLHHSALYSSYYYSPVLPLVYKKFNVDLLSP